MKRRDLLQAGGAAATAALTGAGLARPALAQGSARVLRFVPQANLANPDPIWTTATVALNHGRMVWDTLFGIDMKLNPHPQMLAGHELSDDKRVWRLRLRDGLVFHDNEPVRAIDCVTSINRWSKRNSFGQALGAVTEEMRVLGDKEFEIRLKKPFPHLPYTLGANDCLIMPERIAKTDPFQQINEYVGSGPFRFLRDEWVSGARAAYAKFDKYVPRQEPADFFSGGKVVHVDRVEWIIMPDPATQAAALQTGEIDWIEFPLLDLLPMLKRSPGCRVEVNDPLGVVGIIRPNFLHPPFDNPKLRRAILPAIDQTEFNAAVIGDQPELGKTPVGTFTLGSPFANAANIEVFSGKRDFDLARRLVKESGYNGEPILLMSPSDQASIEAVTQVTRSVFQKIGINVQYEVMDWGTLVSRRANKEPPGKGGWNAFCTSWGGLSVSNPGSHFPLRGNGAGAWFGWPTLPQLETLREQWFDAPDLAAQKKLCEDMQRTAFEEVPYIPTGQWFQPIAVRDNLAGIVRCPSILFWNVRKT